MATRTISRDSNNSRVVCVWPKGIEVDAVKSGKNDAMYAYDSDGVLAQPSLIPTDVFKTAFGFIPNSGSVASYQLHKAVAPETLADKLTSAIRGMVKEALADLD